MTVAFARRTRTRQPDGPVPLDAHNSLTRGIVGWINAASWADRSSMVGTPLAWAGTQDGIALVGNGAGLVTQVTPAFGSEATLLHFGDMVEPAGAQSQMVSIGTSGAGNQIFVIQTGRVSSSTASATIRVADGGGISSAEFKPISTSFYEPEVFVGVYDGTSQLVVYRNGLNAVNSRNNTAASGAMSSMDNFNMMGCNRGTDIFAQAGAKSMLGVVWNRALSATEVAAIGRNPWQLFEPERVPLWAPGPSFQAAWATGANSLVSIGAGHAA